MMDIYRDIFRDYEELVAGADKKFRDMEKGFGDRIKCEIKCSDCCRSVFGIFLIESVYLNLEFKRLDRRNRREILLRVDKAQRELLEIEKRLQDGGQDNQALSMARERVRCPLLDEGGKCVLYSARPLTCRVYGIPTLISGKVRACWKAGFQEGREHPVYDLDGAYRSLYELSKKMLVRLGRKELDRASLLVSVSSSIKTPVEELLKPI
ncbi:MAG: YkgJ family cysteine cluster protein [Actinobacteria bacterium]|nr:YkgJ family cysteine cluster protein [Actinomycetota bacterium]